MTRNPITVYVCYMKNVYGPRMKGSWISKIDSDPIFPLKIDSDPIFQKGPGSRKSTLTPFFHFSHRHFSMMRASAATQRRAEHMSGLMSMDSMSSASSTTSSEKAATAAASRSMSTGSDPR